MTTTNLGQPNSASTEHRKLTQGPLPVPAEVMEFIERELAGRELTQSARREMLNNFTLQYHFGGREVVTRRTAEGIEVHAIGTSNCAAFIRGLTEEERGDYWVEYPDPWQSSR